MAGATKVRQCNGCVFLSMSQVHPVEMLGLRVKGSRVGDTLRVYSFRIATPETDIERRLGLQCTVRL